MPNIPLSGSVGAGGENRAADVRAVKQRLHGLGFDWLTVNGTADAELSRTIRVFQGIKDGDSEIHENDGRVDVGGPTHRWLEAANSPRWRLIQESPGDVGYKKLITPGDDSDHGTDWLQDTFIGAGMAYHQDYLSGHANASLIVINDASPRRGGNAPPHDGHETGLEADCRLPRTDGGAGGINYTDPGYDQAATRAMLTALWAQTLMNRGNGALVFFNDPDLIAEGLCRHAGGHHHHFHVRIKPPVQQAP